MKTILILILCSIIFRGTAGASDIDNEIFEGTWCGAWDDRFPVCFHIPNIAKNDLVIYRWKEFPEGNFSSKEIQLERVNNNTISLDNIFLFLDENQPNQKAIAVGIFKARSRHAILSRQLDSKTNNTNQ